MKTKWCVTCEVAHKVSLFRIVKSKGYSWYSSKCKSAESKIGAEWSKNNRARASKTTSKSAFCNRTRDHEYVVRYLFNNPCNDCGEKDPLVLDFDHVRGKKKANISKLIAHGSSITKLKIEMAKCVVRCANCHRRRSAETLGYTLKLEAIRKVMLELVSE
jgi:hypothetical protein